MNSGIARNVLIILLTFLAIGALFGGGAFVISPGGYILKMPLSYLGNSPFKNFLIPGIILFLIFGVIPFILVFARIKKPVCKLCERINFFKDMHWTWTFCIYVGFALIIWIQVEMIFLQNVVWMHTFYIGYSIVLIFVTLLPQVRNLYKKEIAV
jgi:hypothetical protein